MTLDEHKPNGSGRPELGIPEESAEFRAAEAELRVLELGILTARSNFLRQIGVTHEGQRDLWGVFGYPRVLTTRQYVETYARGGIAGRIVDTMPNATWRGEVELIEDEDPDINTPFEQAWQDLDQRLQIQAKLQRVDKLAGLSTYAVLLIGAPGDLSSELPKVNNDPDKLLYLQPFLGGGGPAAGSVSGSSLRTEAQEADCTIAEYVTDAKDPRFGLPFTYQLKRTQVASPDFQKPVHWTRIIHIAEGLLSDEVFGQPALERVWNLLQDLEKVTAGGAEAFWLRANQGMHLDIDKDMTLPDVSATIDKLKEQADAYKHQLTRWIRTRGVSIETLGSDVANFTGPADAILTQIAGAKGIPKRVLTGSEMGELASSQDRENFKDQINGRQTGYAGPYIVRPLVDRLITYGYLPTPAKGPIAYEVKWPHIQVLTEQEKAEGAVKWASVNATQGEPVFTEAEIRDHWYFMAPLTDEQRAEIKERKEEAMQMAVEQAQAMAPPAANGEKKPGKVLPFKAAEEAEDAEILRVLEAAILADNEEVVSAIVGITHLGGQGSGNFGHEGRPGQVGGSGEGDGGGGHKYERVRFKNGKTVLLRIKNESDTFLQGIEVNKEGDEIIPKGADERLHVIQKTEISGRAPLVMDKMYAQLVKAPKSDEPATSREAKKILTQVLGRKPTLDTLTTITTKDLHRVIAAYELIERETQQKSHPLDRVREELDRRSRMAGDFPGHPFHGNQYTDGEEGRSQEFSAPQAYVEAFLNSKTGLIETRPSPVQAQKLHQLYSAIETALTDPDIGMEVYAAITSGSTVESFRTRLADLESGRAIVHGGQGESPFTAAVLGDRPRLKFKAAENAQARVIAVLRLIVDGLEDPETLEFAEQLLKDVRHFIGGVGAVSRDLSTKMSVLGGPGSGNFGHAGRPGEIGGSAPQAAFTDSSGSGGSSPSVGANPEVTELDDSLSTPVSHSGTTTPLGGDASTAGANGARKLIAEDGKAYLYKPSRDEKWMFGESIYANKAAGLAEREVLSSRVAKEIGFAVPPARIGQVPEALGGNGVLMDWVDAASPLPKGHEIEALQTFSPADRATMVVYDTIIGNVDRHSGNFLVKDGKLVPVDHGFSFGRTYPIDEVLSGRAPHEVYPDHTTGLVFEKYGHMRNVAVGGMDDSWLSKDAQRALGEKIEKIRWSRVLKGSHLSSDEQKALQLRTAIVVQRLKAGELGKLKQDFQWKEK